MASETTANLTPVNPTASVLTTLATKALAAAAGSLVLHGWMSASNTEMFISLGVMVLSLGWSIWQEYGRAIVMSQLAVLKAKSLAQAAALQANNLPRVTISQIAAQSPTMDAAAVTKAIATLPPEVKANVWLPWQPAA